MQLGEEVVEVVPVVVVAVVKIFAISTLTLPTSSLLFIFLFNSILQSRFFNSYSPVLAFFQTSSPHSPFTILFIWISLTGSGRQDLFKEKKNDVLLEN
ncbi:hypothetical protein BKA69DRAFT_1101318 [Paraphysoderma sedebokerense]|nr:hypothetical protein BKA69DRAFT_1101318 [Paraphysoderma sedebokerense]